jgi:RNA polymerase sigma-70 factor (ECF subfamily)
MGAMAMQVSEQFRNHCHGQPLGAARVNEARAYAKSSCAQSTDCAQSVDEPALIVVAQRGDVNAFNDLVRAYQHRLYHTGYRVLGDEEAARDATQDAFVSAYKHIRSFRGGSFKHWLVTIVTNACYDRLRAQRARPATSLDALLERTDNSAHRLTQDRSESPHEFAERQELSATIQRGLDTLPPEFRLVLILSDINGLEYDEIAETTGLALGTVKSRLSRGRARLREFLLTQKELLPREFHPSTSQAVAA